MRLDHDRFFTLTIALAGVTACATTTSSPAPTHPTEPTHRAQGQAAPRDADDRADEGPAVEQPGPSHEQPGPAVEVPNWD